MTDKEAKQISKFLSYVLRHHPELIGITLNAQGWVGIEDLLAAAAAHNRPISTEQLQAVVANNDKKRFEIDVTGQMIRASQGHSVQVDLGYTPAEPPAVLYHGTAQKYVDSIRQQGIVKGSRHHVHLSATQEVALQVGQRHGKPEVLTVNCQAMQADGHTFYLSTNGVWLVNHVAPQYIE